MEQKIISENIDSLNLPFSMEAEQAVLGAVLMDPACMPQVLTLLKPEHFYLPQHKDIFKTMVNLDAVGSKIDVLIVLEQLKSDNVFDDAGGKNYLFQLAQSVPSTANVEAYAKIVREKFYVRTLIGVSREIIESATGGDESADALLDAAEQKIYSIRQGRVSSGPQRIGDVIFNDVYDRLNKLTSPDKDLYKGIPTGLSDLDRVISGLNRSDLIILGARPAMGKTSLALNIARNVALLAKKKVLFFSLEMSNEQLAQRVLSTEARVKSEKMRSGDLNDDDWVRIGEAAALLMKCELYFDDTSNITVPEMKARVRRLKDVDCVIVDYLQLMQSAKKTENRVQEVSEITRSLKLMAKDLQIPVITCAQLARGPETKTSTGQGVATRKPVLSDLRESGSIEQDADIVLMLYREAYGKEGSSDAAEYDFNKAELGVAKNRHGPTDNVELAWSPEFTLFSTKEKYLDEE
ncbi:MAG: replicative DNA helicase [Clostridiales bacterium]|nr:replicative DNA helicase [Clostridiales bacterium]